MMTYAGMEAEGVRQSRDRAVRSNGWRAVETNGHEATVVGVGWSVWEKAPADSDYRPRGGVVVHVVPQAELDVETGELLDRYVVVNVYGGKLAWVSLRADQVAPVTDSSRPNASTIRGVCQVAAREAAKCRRDERLLELFSLGTRLMAVVARPSSVPVP